MKIVILGPAHPFRGGIAALNDRLAKQLQDEGHEVVLYSFSLQYPKLLFPGKTQYTDDPAPEGLRIFPKVNSINPFNWLKVGRELRIMAPDLLLVRYWLPFMGPALGTICRQARRNKKTKVICIADNIIPHEKRFGDRMFTKYFTSGSDGFIAMSHDVYEDITLFVKEPLRRYTPHPVYDHYGERISREEALDALGLDAAYRYLLFFGFIRDYKGLDLLLRAMGEKELREQNVRLIVAGEFYSDEEKTLHLIRELGIAEQVILRSDYIPNDCINRYFCAADIVVQPYKTATQSGVTQIGYHFEKPMLVTNVGGLPEIVADRQSGYVVEPDPKSIASALSDFYDNNRQAAFETETRKLKGKYAWNKMTAVIFELYDAIKSR